MGWRIICREHDADQFMLWTTITDSPIFLGTREELEGWYQENHTTNAARDQQMQNWRHRIDKAIELGSDSALGVGRWDDDGMVLMEDGGPGWVRRENFPAMFDAFAVANENEPPVTDGWLDPLPED